MALLVAFDVALLESAAAGDLGVVAGLLQDATRLGTGQLDELLGLFFDVGVAKGIKPTGLTFGGLFDDRHGASCAGALV